MTYSSLHNHTHYSILDSIISPKDLFKKAKELNIQAVAVTDHGSLAGAWDCLKESKNSGVKLIIGCEMYFTDDVKNKEDKLRHIILLAKNAEGYKNLLLLNYSGFLNGIVTPKRVVPTIDWQLLEKYNEGLICLTSCGNGIISKLLNNKKFEEAENVALRLKNIFRDNLGLEIQANNMKRFANNYNDEIDQQFTNRQIIKLAEKLNIKVVPTSNSHYILKDDYLKHDTALCIASGQSIYSNFRLKYNVPDFYLKSEEDIYNFFERNYPDKVQEFIDNTKYFSDLCENPDWIDPKYTNPSGKELPKFNIQSEIDYNEFKLWLESQSDIIKQLDEDKSYLQYKVFKIFEDRKIRDNISEDKYQLYIDRIYSELDVLQELDLCSYMLITADFLKYARNNNISVGPGRGCLAGDTKVLTKDGYKNLDSIQINDEVYTHTGNSQKVLATFKYKVDEELLSIKTNNFINPIKLTKDHKVYGNKNKNEKPIWIEAKDLNIGDYVYTTFPNDKGKFILDDVNLNMNVKSYYSYDNGFYSEITEISNCKEEYVYDINVNSDNSYLTSNHIVHNSAGGSYIAYLLDIHIVDSIKYGLVFERFHNKLKKAVSDIDNDISALNRDKVLEYVSNKYGKDNVAHVANINRITPKVFARDIARAHEFGGSKEEAVKIGTNIADSISKDNKDCIVFDDVYNNEPFFAAFCDKYKELLINKDLLGKPRSIATHAAGIIIGKRNLSELVPIRKDKDDNTSIEYDKEVCEENGLVKIDFLGLKTLDIIDLTLKLIKESYNEIPEINLEEYDKSTYDLITLGNTLGVFQFGTSAGTIDLCKKIKPKSIEDLAIITTLARPASKQIREEFIETFHGRKSVKYFHPSLQNALKSTYGYPLYDESLLILAKDVAGWDLGEADKLRKLTKEKGKNPEKARKWEKEFIDGSINNGLTEKEASDIWEKIIEPFGKYSFNKSIFEEELVDIYTSTGEFITKKKIKDVKVGDFVRSRDEITKKDIFVMVKGNHDHGKLPLVEVELDTGEKIKCTINHKFRVKQNGNMLPLWKIIDEKLSIVVDTIKKNDTVISNIKTITPVGEGQTYDLEIDHDDHQYYLSNGMLTSNSHAVLYSLISYKTAYLKAHYPLEFLLANLITESALKTPDSEDLINKFKSEIRALNIKVMSPDINKSEMIYKIQKGELITGLDAIKFVGNDAIKDIIEKRPFKSFFDFMARVSTKHVRANSIQALAATGCLDSFGINRRAIFLYCSDYRKKLTTWLKKHDPNTEEFVYPWPEVKDWTKPELYALEKKYLGESFTVNKSDAYGDFFKQSQYVTIKDIIDLPDKTFIPSFKGEIKSVFFFKVRKEGSKAFGKEMCKLLLEDTNNQQIGVTIFPDTLEQVKLRLKKAYKNKIKLDENIAIHFSGSINIYQDEKGLILNELYFANLPPEEPKDKGLKKVAIQEEDKKEVNKNKSELDILYDIEEELFNEGLLDLDIEIN